MLGTSRTSSRKRALVNYHRPSEHIAKPLLTLRPRDCQTARKRTCKQGVNLENPEQGSPKRFRPADTATVQPNHLEMERSLAERRAPQGLLKKEVRQIRSGGYQPARDGLELAGKLRGEKHTDDGCEKVIDSGGEKALLGRVSNQCR